MSIDGTDSVSAAGGVYETKKETVKNPQEFVRRWLQEIKLAEKVQKDWLKQAKNSRDMFRSEGDHEDQRFNIQFANVQTLLPALYSSRPTPDVRKRYGDKKDREGAARIASQVIERNLSVSMDQYDFDGVMAGAVQNGLLTGRGVPRVRHLQIQAGQHVFNQVRAEVAPWRDFVIGPCEVWEDRPWIAFRHFLGREELTAINEKIGPTLKLDHTLDEAKGDEGAERTPNVFKRAVCWEVWDLSTRTQVWLAESHTDAPLAVNDDPLGLVDFFPVPKPYYTSETTDTMVPMVPVEAIKSLVTELEDISRRIQAIVRVIKWRGFADPALNIGDLENASDGTLVAVSEGILQLVQSGGLERHIWMMPIERAVEALQALYVQRDQIKQTIYEITGISDIIRGASDPNETLGAQELKANYGTLRLQFQQGRVQRMVRDVLRIKAELMCSHFGIQEMLRQAGIKLPTQIDKQMAQQQIQAKQQQAQMMAQQQPPGQPGQEQAPQPEAPQIPPEIEEMMKQPTVEEVEAIIKDDMIRTYVIDIETDSTVQQDLRQVQGNMSSFLDGTAKFLQAIGPMVQAGQMKADTAIDLYQPFARSYHLGKQAEDALERMSEDAQEIKNQPQPPDPAAEAMKMEMAKVEAEMKAAQEKHQLEMQSKQMDAQIKQGEASASALAKQADMQITADMKRAELEYKQQMQALEIEHKTLMAQLELEKAQAMGAISQNNARAKAQQNGATRNDG